MSWETALTTLAKEIRIVAEVDTTDGAPIPYVANAPIDGLAATHSLTLQNVGSTSGTVNPVTCSAEIRGTTISILDRGAWFTELLRDWELRERVITLHCGFAGMDWTDYEIVFKGRISRLLCSRPGVWTLSIDDLRRSLKSAVFTGATEAVPVAINDENPIDILIGVLTDAGANGLEIPAALVDVAGMETIRDDFYSVLEFSFSIDEPQEAKEWLEREICLPLGLYFTTLPNGQISLRRTAPPLGAEAAAAPVVTADHIVGDVRVSVDLRDLLNEILWKYDWDAVAGEFDSIEYYVDSDSLTEFRQSRRLDIESRGLETAMNALVASRTAQLFERFADPYPYYRLTTTLRHCRLQPGQLVALRPQQTPNLATGTLEWPSALFCEVLAVNTNFERGTVDLTLVGTPFDLTRTGRISDLVTDYENSGEVDRGRHCWIGRAADNKVFDGVDWVDGYVILFG